MNLCDVLIDEPAVSNIQRRKETNNDSWDSAILDEFKENNIPMPISKMEISKGKQTLLVSSKDGQTPLDCNTSSSNYQGTRQMKQPESVYKDEFTLSGLLEQFPQH